MQKGFVLNDQQELNDLELVIDRIKVYENHIDIQLKSEIIKFLRLLQTGCA